MSKSPFSTVNSPSTTNSTVSTAKITRRKPIESNSSPFLPILSNLNPSSLLKWHNFLLSCHLTNLHSPQQQISTESNLKMMVFSWNVNQAQPQKVDFKNFLDSNMDIIVINLQETISLTALKSSKEKIDEWGTIITNSINMMDTSKTFKSIYKTGLLGLTTILIVNESLIDQIHDIESDSIGLGYLRWANKGCISLKFKVGGLDIGQELSKESLDYPHVHRLKRLPSVQVQILNVHLVHGEGDNVVVQRYESWNKIGNKLKLVDPSVGLTNLTVSKNTSGIKDDRKSHCEEDLNVFLKLSESEKIRLGPEGLIPFKNTTLTQVHDPRTCVIVSGDTNYRLKTGWDSYLGSSFDRKDVEELVSNGRFSDLIQRDQLTMERFKNNIFLGFKEAEINFPPTFKLNQSNPLVQLNANDFIPNYDGKRLPAYTDRILFVPRDHIELKHYKTTPLIGSDHLPVLATFDLQAQLINHEPLKRFKEEFLLKWDRILNSIKLIKLDSKVRLISKIGQINSLSDSFLFVQHLDLLNLNLQFDIMNGENALVCLNFQNESEEILTFEFKDEDSSRWFNSNKSIIEFTPLAHDNEDEEGNKKFLDIDYSLNGFTSNGLCSITPNDNVLATVQLKPSSPGVINKTYKLSIPSLMEIPDAQKFIAITFNVKDIFIPSIVELEELQFDNLLSCFEFLFTKKPSKSLLENVKDVSSPSDFTMNEWDLVRTLTLWEFQAHDNIKELFKILYIWLKCQNNDLISSIDERSRLMFKNVIKIIMWLKLDQNTGYTWFGWLFQDPEELLEVLEREDYKFDLNLL